MTLLIIIIVLALIFDFINGFHDAANSIATVVSTKVLTPTQAVIWAAFFNFVAYFIAVHFLGGFGDSIANTVAKTVESEFITSHIIIAGIIAAITWNLITWWFGIPSSSSHTLIGGFGGAAIAGAGFQSVHMETVSIIVLFIFLAPLIGMIAGNIITIITLYAMRNVRPGKADRWFKGLQLLSSALLSIGHGLNDSQKVMGIIAAALIANRTIPDLPSWMYMENMDNMPEWIPLSCFTAIALGTMSGGWKIMKTMGNRITKITPLEGFCAQTAGSITLFISEMLHVPVSTTHVISGSIIGVGSVKRLSAVRWGITKDLLVAWTITIPVSSLLAAFFYWVLKFIL
ncbi:inorganic phosphate transporter [Dysgonomonas sp. 216]|uniref:inorganic phosphate transporter n=1 Tax=Dysgonomonas sp. 216 TaxID=2302934 RepID=UPI0013D21A7E|nr:inorganic phosphate transporter [Dysgonomonas sp. 216]NDW18852.1 inorganic phosphate transporter [Dysgonomonas sp. 216]